MTRPIPLFTLLIVLAVPLSLLAGRVWLDPWTTPNAAVILAELRLPRALLAITVGAGLGAAGAAMQGYLRNPLADPGLFGIAPERRSARWRASGSDTPRAPGCCPPLRSPERAGRWRCSR